MTSSSSGFAGLVHFFFGIQDGEAVLRGVAVIDELAPPGLSGDPGGRDQRDLVDRFEPPERIPQLFRPSDSRETKQRVPPFLKNPATAWVNARCDLKSGLSAE